jgi:transglutaminase-like putative cysteine protease
MSSRTYLRAKVRHERSMRILTPIVALLLLSLVATAGTRDSNSRSWQLTKDDDRQFPRYLVEYRVCLLISDDTVKSNELSNQLDSIGDGRSGRKVPTIGDTFERTNILTLRYHSNSKNIEYEIEPKPIRTQADPQKNEIHFYFDKTDTLGKIPFVTVRAAIEPEISLNPYTQIGNRQHFLKPTTTWPTDSDLVRSVLAQIPINGTSELTKLESLLHWLKSESGISQGVEPRGERATRYGVRHLLEKKHGNCWDYSDLLVTLCRSLNLPCRQIAGWQKSGGGHVWAEVYLTNLGWIQVNPTTGQTLDEDYVPLFTTSDGKMSIVYRSFPVMKEIGAE